MSPPRMLSDILAQPESLAQVIGRQTGCGQSALREAARILRQARSIVVSGMGGSLYAAMPLANGLAGIGLPVSAVEASELLHYRPELARDAVVVLVSRSGDTVEVRNLLPVLKERNAFVIGVTNEPSSSLTREAGHTILVGSRSDEIVAVQTYTGTVAALLMLWAAVHGLDCRPDLDRFLAAYPGALERCLAGSGQWRTFFAEARVIHLLGRGPALASAQAGALLFNEASKIPAVAMSSATFRHGPVEVVDVGFRALVFASARKTEDLEFSLAGDILRFGGSVYVLGGRNPGGLPRWPVADTADWLAPLADIAPVQVAAFRLAEWRGLVPGQFRFASQVTTSEASFSRQTPA